METIIIIVTIIFSFLNLMLFCKIWGACNNTKRIKSLLFLFEGIIRQSYASNKKEFEGFAAGDLIYDNYDRLHIIKDITEDNMLICTELNSKETRIFAPTTNKLKKKDIQLIGVDDIC